MPSTDNHPPYVEKLITDVAQVSQQALQRVSNAQELGELCEGVFGFAQDMLQAVIVQEPPPESIDCSTGCWYCCTSESVMALPIEVLAVANTLQGHTLPDALIETFDRHPPGTYVDLRQEGRICPLLQDQACSVYNVRPSPCRGFNAYDHNTCKAKKVDGQDAKIIGYAHQRLVYQAAMTGLALGCERFGAECDLIDLPSALLVAHDDLEGCTERWLKGKTVFTSPTS